MSKFETQFLRNFNKGDYMCWHVCTQCQNLGEVVLKDDSKTYFTAKKTSSSTGLQHLSKDGATYDGGSNLRLEFKIETGCELDISKVAGAIVDRKSNNVGFIYDFCVEDGTDNDYNDFYVNIVAWNRKG